MKSISGWPTFIKYKWQNLIIPNFCLERHDNQRDGSRLSDIQLDDIQHNGT